MPILMYDRYCWDGVTLDKPGCRVGYGAEWDDESRVGEWGYVMCVSELRMKLSVRCMCIYKRNVFPTEWRIIELYYPHTVSDRTVK